MPGLLGKIGGSNIDAHLQSENLSQGVCVCKLLVSSIFGNFWYLLTKPTSCFWKLPEVALDRERELFTVPAEEIRGVCGHPGPCRRLALAPR